MFTALFLYYHTRVAYSALREVLLVVYNGSSGFSCSKQSCTTGLCSFFLTNVVFISTTCFISVSVQAV